MPRPVCKKDIFYNDKLTVINDIVILNDDNHTVLKPSCYFGDRMLVEARRNGHRSFRWVTLADGLTDEYTDDLYWEGSTEPLWKDTRMVNAGTGKLEYMSPEWGVDS